jgi:hypothetical protein
MPWTKAYAASYNKEYRARNVLALRAKKAAYYQANREKILGYQDERRQLVSGWKNQPCMDCGKNYPPYVMEFDHLDPDQKLFNIGQSMSRAIHALEVEVAKCDVVCANCHKQREHDRRQGNGS